jgi:hypothetical protein
MLRAIQFLCALHCAIACVGLSQAQQDFIDFDADELEDRIRGGMLGQVLGNLNGLPHEFKYIDEPGDVKHYVPSLSDGAHTDDDTDIEWVYLREIARSRECFLPPDRIAALWKRHINRRIWCANLYARGLMELGIEPPWTGNVGLNPWAEFNISGQFVCESFGLMAPAMPQTAARLGLNYTHVTIDGEPAQATQLFTTMIAMAFVASDVDKLLDAGLAAVDPQSEIADVVREVRKICAANPNDWEKTRSQIKQRWQTHGGAVRDRNGYELNTACTIAALIYGQHLPSSSGRGHGEGDPFVETLRLAFNFGWDCDNNAATAATIVGVMKGRRWMNDQGWDIVDVYRNTTRDEMPQDETLAGFENTLIEAARVTIELRRGEIPLPFREGQGEGSSDNQKRIYRIRVESPANIEPLATSAAQIVRLRETFAPRLRQDLAAAPTRARAAYIAICLGEVERLKQDSPVEWTEALAALQSSKTIMKNLFAAHGPAADRLKQAAIEAGLTQPAK